MHALYLSTYAHLRIDLERHTSAAAANSRSTILCSSIVKLSMDLDCDTEAIKWRRFFSLRCIELIKFSCASHLVYAYDWYKIERLVSYTDLIQA